MTEQLRQGAVVLVADVGQPLRWLRGDEMFAWWKREAKPRLLDPANERWSLDVRPGQQGWLDTERQLHDGSAVVSFEAFH